MARRTVTEVVRMTESKPEDTEAARRAYRAKPQRG